MVEVNYHTPEEFQIGNTIRLLPGTEDTDLSETLATDTYTIVGVVESAMYLGYERGHSTIGDGKVVAFLMIPEEDFTLSVYTDVYLTLEGTEGLSAFSDGYTGAVDEMSGKFEAVAAAGGKPGTMKFMTKPSRRSTTLRQSWPMGKRPSRRSFPRRRRRSLRRRKSFLPTRRRMSVP